MKNVAIWMSNVSGAKQFVPSSVTVTVVGFLQHSTFTHSPEDADYANELQELDYMQITTQSASHFDTAETMWCCCGWVGRSDMLYTGIALDCAILDMCYGKGNPACCVGGRSVVQTHLLYRHTMKYNLQDKAAGEPCTGQGQCVDNAECSVTSAGAAGTCECDKGYYSDKGSCIKRKLVGEPCATSGQCVDKANCSNGVCQCTQGHYNDMGRCAGSECLLVTIPDCSSCINIARKARSLTNVGFRN